MHTIIKNVQTMIINVYLPPILQAKAFNIMI